MVAKFKPQKPHDSFELSHVQHVLSHTHYTESPLRTLAQVSSCAVLPIIAEATEGVGRKHGEREREGLE